MAQEVMLFAFLSEALNSKIPIKRKVKEPLRNRSIDFAFSLQCTNEWNQFHNIGTGRKNPCGCSCIVYPHFFCCCRGSIIVYPCCMNKFWGSVVVHPESVLIAVWYCHIRISMIRGLKNYTTNQIEPEIGKSPTAGTAVLM